MPLVVQAPLVQIVAETAELLSDVQVPQVRVVAQTVEISQSLFGGKIDAIPEVLFRAGMKRTMKRIAQQPVGSQQQQQDNQPQAAKQSTRQERRTKWRIKQVTRQEPVRSEGPVILESERESVIRMLEEYRNVVEEVTLRWNGRYRTG